MSDFKETVLHERFMRQAIELARENVRAGGGGPFAAIVARDGAVLGAGVNLVTSTNDPTAHAEIVAIRNACRALKDFQLSGCDLYTTCEPCPMCLGAIYWARPSRVFYAATSADAAAAGFDDSFIYRQMALPPGERNLPMIPLVREEAIACFQDWEEKTDKVRY